MKHRLFLWICVFALTPAKGFLGAGKLVQHYLEHKKQKADLGVVEFLYVHYASEKHEQDGHPQKDHQLPFLTLDVVSLIPNWSNNSVPMAWLSIDSPLQSMDRPCIPDFSGVPGVSLDIWQPPKVG